MSGSLAAREDRRTAVAAAGATLLGSCALTPVYTTGAWFPPVLAAVLVVLGGGLLLRGAGPTLWRRISARPPSAAVAAAAVPLVPLVQLVLLTCLMTAFYAPQDAILGAVPTSASLADLAGVLVDGSAELYEQATPALPLTGLVALTVLMIGLIAVAVDFVAVAGRQAALAGLGLLVVYCVPVGTVVGGIGLLAMTAPASGLALLLWSDQRRRLAGQPRTARARLLGTGARPAVRTVLLALVAGLVVGAVVPTFAEGSFGTGLGSQAGPGEATGTALDPVAALQGQLIKPEPIRLLRVETSVDDPGYLRAVALDQYDADNGWTVSNLDGEIAVADEDRLTPVPPGVQTRPVTATITAVGHADRFLPVFSAPQTVRVQDAADDEWRFDPTTGTVFGRDASTAERIWGQTAVEPRPPADLLAQAAQLPSTDPLQARYTQLPPLDPSVRQLVDQLTATTITPYDRVRAIHGYLTDRRNGFIYSLSTAPGTADDDLTDFLRLKRGYCEQYAGAMAVMARAAGVPARVVLGYTPGSRQTDGSRLVTSDDAHAWVEVWFDGVGWLPFDPTPIAPTRAVDLPWVQDTPTQQTPGDLAGAPLPTPSPAAPSLPRERAGQPLPTVAPALQDTGWSRILLVGAGAVLLGAALVAAPGTARVWRRRRRLADGGPPALWDELAATAVDLGLPLDPAHTPRQTAGDLTEVLAGPAADSTGRRGLHGPGAASPAMAEPAADAVRLLALAEETASYGRPGSASQQLDLTTALHTARRALVRATPRRRRWVALLWPASLVAEVRAGTASGLRRAAEALGSRRGTRTV